MSFESPERYFKMAKKSKKKEKTEQQKQKELKEERAQKRAYDSSLTALRKNKEYQELKRSIALKGLTL